MARIRTVKPEFWRSPSMRNVCRDARLLFIGLWNEADDEGRLVDSPKLLAGTLFAFDEDLDERSVDMLLATLEREKCVVRYVVGGHGYLQIVNWHHQKIDKRGSSKIPDQNGKMPRRKFGERSSKGRRTFDSVSRDLGNKGSPVVEALCASLADHVEKHRGSRPKIVDAWYRDMDYLLRLGPLGIELPSGWGAERIERGIGLIFAHLNTRAANGFCWADQVRSPASLRKHWDACAQAFKATTEAGTTITRDPA